MLALKVYGDVLYRYRDQLPVVKEEKEELSVGSEGLWRCEVYGDVLYRSRDRCVQFVPVLGPATGGRERETQWWLCRCPETDVFRLYRS